MRQNSTDTIIENGMASVACQKSFESYDIKPEAFDARASRAFLSEEGWLG